ncbi:MAG TPA: ATP-binding protein [Tepiditoga sp.]|nr:ATP-binding protein [Thermotogota bacterium]HOO74439.1 ATP-binding protein [Tepiditoga sp.]
MNFFKITIPSNSLYIKLIRSSLNSFLYLCNYKNDDEIFLLELALNEAVANIIEHTYNYEENHIIDIEFIFEDNYEFKIKIRDYGKKVNPEEIKPRDLNDYREGGLGTFIIKQVFTEQNWVSVDEGNLLVLSKKLV